ncbi:MAG: 1-deoxy-D-xylulose-5-phosphate reductoisomerase [Chitinispirillia bacterium]|nr:1-deoxy-D-xylulose-5-phosphate reductoisomerase [Chitinispirillia bacterium]MCL2241766.1 1-deoxy-D-xylulose-5-phosphate reductoisomerase [Chitinispirillia bacterium]
MVNNHTKILILGSTGSIGKSACNCVRRFKYRFSVAGLTAGSNVDLLTGQIREFSPASIYITGSQNADLIKDRFKNLSVYSGDGGLEQIVNEADYDILLNALVGAVGFRPTVAALKRGKRVALANKESLVIGGDYIRAIIGQDNERRLLPVDSEHSAILQCLPSSPGHHNTIESIILTASGGPFRSLPKDKFASITPEQALNHPTWSMGKKITIDSSTLMNKGFEVIEAHHLFATPYDKLRVCVHPQSIVHSMVEFHDGAVLAQLGLPDMELPIQYALSWPNRLPIPGKRLNLPDIKSLDFSDPDMDRFPCMRLCIDAGKTGGTAPAAVNAANEVAVDLFLNKRIGYTGISEIVESALNEHTPLKADSVEVIEDADRETRKKILNKYRS